METIGVKYTIPTVRLNVTPAGNQNFNLHYRLISEDDDLQNTDNVGWVSAGTYTVNNKGENINGTTLTNLVGGYDYQLRFTHAITGSIFYCYFRTCENTSAGDSPYYNKILFPNQTYDWYVSGLADMMLPDKKSVAWYYSLRGTKAITVEYDAYHSVGLYAEDSWDFGVTYDNTKENYQAFHCNGANICRLPFGSSNEDADHPYTKVFGGDAPTGSFGMSIFIKPVNTNMDFLCLRQRTGAGTELVANYDQVWSIRIHPTDRTKIQITNWVKSTGVETIVETATMSNGFQFETSKWYNLVFSGINSFAVYNDSAEQISSVSFSDSPYGGRAAGAPTGLFTADSPVIFGSPRGITSGILVNRLYIKASISPEELDTIKILGTYKFYPVPGFYQGGNLIYKAEPSTVTKVDNERVSIVIEPDITRKGVSPGTLNIKLLMTDENIEVASKTFTLKRVEDNVQTEAFDIDFVSNYADAMTQLKQRFYTKHGHWGGYNGGVNGNLVYGNGKDALIMGNHGDKYSGAVVGVGKETDKGSSYDGYGGPSTYDAYNDTRKGSPFKTRVGSVLVSNKYFGYGEMTVSMLLPKGTYGVCPAFWFFHYQEYGESDVRYQPWINRGWPRQGTAEDGYYIVVNNEIDIELPSHNIQGSFNDWNEVATAYFDPLALDTQYHIGLKQTATNLSYTKVGLFRLVDVTKPNLFASWVQVDYEFKTRIEPNYSTIKFNNWIGEYDSGNGWAKTEARYRAEETYLALLTKVKEFNDTFADNRYHDYTIKWYPDRTELWIDGVYVRTNRAFVPFNVMKYTVGGWFPSMPKRKVITDPLTNAFRYEVKDTDNGNVTITPGVNPVGTWAGVNANFEICNFLINRIKFTPYNDVDSSNLEYSGESFPESGLREII